MNNETEFMKQINSQPTLNPIPKMVQPPTYTAEEILGMTLPETNWIIQDILPEGSALFSGKPKKGKSWLMMLIAINVAAGREVFGKPTTQSDVLYLGLEDNWKRIQKRLRICLGKMNMEASELGGRLHFRITSAKLKGGLDVQIRDWMQDHPETKLIVIDMLKHVAPTGKKSGVLYDTDSEKGGLVTEIARQYDGLAIVVVHHSKKGDGTDISDPHDLHSGSTGLTGSFDNLYVIIENGRDKALGCVGKDADVPSDIPLNVDERDFYTLKIEPRKTLLDTLPEERQKIIKAIMAGCDTPATISDYLGKNPSTIGVQLRQALDAGDIKKEGRGRYSVTRLDFFDEQMAI